MFEFICADCQHQFEELVMSSEELVPCPKCGTAHVERQLSAFAFKTGDVFRSAPPSGGGGCSGCHPGPGGCGSCRH